jgi:hypothetical protein
MAATKGAKVKRAEKYKARKYAGTNVRALRVQAQMQRERTKFYDRLWAYAAVGLIAFMGGVWLGIVLTNGA